MTRFRGKSSKQKCKAKICHAQIALKEKMDSRKSLENGENSHSKENKLDISNGRRSKLEGRMTMKNE